MATALIGQTAEDYIDWRDILLEDAVELPDLIPQGADSDALRDAKMIIHACLQAPSIPLRADDDQRAAQEEAVAALGYTLVEWRTERGASVALLLGTYRRHEWDWAWAQIGAEARAREDEAAVARAQAAILGAVVAGRAA